MPNSITILGRLGRDAEVRYTPSGVALAAFSLADTIGFGDREQTNWYNCSHFLRDKSKMADHLTKGKLVMVVGELTLRAYTDNTGNKRVSPDIKVERVTFVTTNSPGYQDKDREGGKPTSTTQVHEAPPPPPPGQAFGDTPDFDDEADDIPF